MTREEQAQYFERVLADTSECLKGGNEPALRLYGNQLTVRWRLRKELKRARRAGRTVSYILHMWGKHSYANIYDVSAPRKDEEL